MKPLSDPFPLLLFISVLILMAPASARVVQGLNAARVAVADRSDIEFARGTSKALEAVLVKQTGNSAAPTTQAGRAVLAKAKRLVQQFGYERSKDGSNPVLRVVFDSVALAQAMTASNLAVWGKERPETLLYLVINDGSNTRVLTANEPKGNGGLTAVFRRRAANRAIPVMFPAPAMAALINNGSSAADIVAGLAAAQDESLSDCIAVGQFTQTVPGLWEANWTMRIGAEQLRFSRQGDILELLAEESVDSLADVLGRRYANPNVLSNREQVAINVTGIRNSSDFARVQRYLTALDAVDGLFVQSVSGNEMQLTLSVQGGYRGLAQSVDLGRVLISDPSTPSHFQLAAP